MKNLFVKIITILLLSFDCCAQNNFNESEFDEFSYEIPVVKDEYEKINRKIFYFNQKLDLYFVDPVLLVYRKIPKPVRASFANLSDTILESPVKIYTSLAAQQGEIAMQNSARFFINFTFGFLGLFDAASNMGIEKADFSLGDVFTYYGMPAGNYVVLPLIGGNTARGAVSIPFVMAMSSATVSKFITADSGMLMYFFVEDNTLVGGISTSQVADSVISQFYIWHIIDEYEPLKRQIREGSLDYYTAYKTLFFQVTMVREKTIKELRYKHTKTKLSDNIPFSDNRMLDIY
jgi:ABC-type transporter lipoprotein component MlaA